VSSLNQALNNRETFVKLYEKYMPRVYRYIHYKVNNQLLAEDLTSTVFEKALDHFDKYSSDNAAFSTWIFSITRHAIIDYYRTEGKKKYVSLDEAEDKPSPEESPFEKLQNKDEKECLNRCISRLSGEEQEIIHLKFGAEMSNHQIAEMLGISESNAGVKLFRTIKKLKEYFQESWK
jgi:RNA polymerase sigma factor (sigma-70 family)